ncbi:ATP-dependent helicase [Succinivibrio dextrinosolvens]|uniref:ATP-dependent helicase n=1 Tax=Succinivibrio dextrinosolvens TaxID=83771 RepID=UPI00241E0D67|nr:UvrD-helicase domain-containing protein [Succinivibrio dextrinosolvens]MBE6423227.1 DNA helicase II [Succinivibrio dextrinosolvens]
MQDNSLYDMENSLLEDALDADPQADRILEGLNESQHEAVSSELRNMLIIAGAGTGKTRVLVSRIAWLIKHFHIAPRNIMAVTFTNKAATEMRERLALMVGNSVQMSLWANTFHSICLRLLRAYASYAGLIPGFTILDTDSQVSLVKRLMKDMNIDTKEFKPSDIASNISKQKENGVRALAFSKMISAKSPDHVKVTSQVYNVYERVCNQENSVDFSELLLRTVELLENNQEIRELQHRRFKEILVDEFQDTNAIQYRFLRLIAGPDSHVLVVGDDDQSIYGWRGADVSNMRKFLKDFSNVKEVLLALNYRSTQKILDVANTIIGFNSDRLMEKVLKGNFGEGEKVRILNCANNKTESSAVSERIASLHESGVAYRDIAILYRNNYLSLDFEQTLLRKHIPFVIYGGQKFFERAEILDAIAYMRILVNEDDDTALLRIINTPSRKIGPKVVDGLRTIANERNCSLIKAMRLLEAHVNSDNVDKTLASLYKKVAVFCDLLKVLKEKKESLSLSAFADEMLRITGLYQFYQEKDFKDGKDNEEHSRYANLGMLISNIKEFESNSSAPSVSDESAPESTSDSAERNEEDPLLTYLSNITLVSTGELNEEGETASGTDAVNLMTMHSSKGLEFKYVFLVGFEKDILPSRMCAFSDKSLAEERRLAYVGVTRAKTALYISYSQNRSLFGKVEATGASSFLRELVREYKGKHDVPLTIESISSASYY